MVRKIPVLVDEDIYYHLQQLCIPPTKDLGEVIRSLLLSQEEHANDTRTGLERSLRQRDLVAELNDGRRLVANSR